MPYVFTRRWQALQTVATGTRPTAKSRSGFEPVFFYGNQQSQPPLMPSLALIGHLIDSVDGGRGGAADGALSRQTPGPSQGVSVTPSAGPRDLNPRVLSVLSDSP